MKSKQTILLDYLKQHPQLLQCPHCKQVLHVDNTTLQCPNGHRFDIPKKGTLTLVKTHLLKQDDVYNKELFESRRRFISKGFYKHIHDSIQTYIKPETLWCDMGSGEGSHGNEIIKDTSAMMVGIDLAKPAISLASDFIYNGYISVVGDLAHMPLASESVDGILNFLSPSNELEMMRILKNDGIILKVVPGKNYLKELRAGLEMDAFEPTHYEFKHFVISDRIHHEQVYDLSKEDLEDLLKMTPLSQYKNLKQSFNTISIDLEILVLKKKEEA